MALIPPAWALAALEVALNRYLALDPETVQRLGTLAGKVIGLELSDLGVTLYVVPNARGLQLLGRYEGAPEVLIAGTSLNLLRTSAATRKDTALFSGDVVMRGDVAVGQAFQEVLEHIDIDWEEHLAQITGDVLAHHIGNVVRGALDTGRQAVSALTQDLGEYLQEETRLLPTRVEMDEFLARVDTLRNDAERLAARVARLHTRLGEPGGAGS